MVNDLNLTDMETCYKVFRREVIQSITIEENRFGLEPEITAKVARGGYRIYDLDEREIGRIAASAVLHRGLEKKVEEFYGSEGCSLYRGVQLNAPTMHAPMRWLMLGAGIVFLMTNNIAVLMIAAIIGVISPSGNEIGPFLSVEQASLTQLVHDRERTRFFAWYNLAGSFATATGALAGGWLAQGLQHNGWGAIESYRVVLTGYALGGFLLLLLFFNLTNP